MVSARGRRVLGACLTLLTFGPVLQWHPPAYAQAQSAIADTVFGPKRYVRTTGKPDEYDDRFTLPAGATGPFTIRITNGDDDGHRVSSATITLNGIAIAQPKDFSQNVAALVRTVTLQTNNTLHVTLASAPGSF